MLFSNDTTRGVGFSGPRCRGCIEGRRPPRRRLLIEALEVVLNVPTQPHHTDCQEYACSSEQQHACDCQPIGRALRRHGVIFDTYCLLLAVSAHIERSSIPTADPTVEERHMDMRHVRVDSVIRNRVEVTSPAVDTSPVDHITDRWMFEYGVENGDVVQAVDVEIYGVDAPVTVWVVVTRSGLVLAVAEPPVGVSLPPRPAGVDSPPQPAP